MMAASPVIDRGRKVQPVACSMAVMALRKTSRWRGTGIALVRIASTSAPLRKTAKSIPATETRVGVAP